jgi:hypothetical protein
VCCPQHRRHHHLWKSIVVVVVAMQQLPLLRAVADYQYSTVPPIGYDSTAATDGSGIARKKMPLWVELFSKMIVDIKSKIDSDS